MDKKKEERIAKQEIRGIMPAKDLSALLQQSINLTSAIEILNARTKTLERLIAENGVKEKKKPRFTFPPLKQVRGDKKTDDSAEQEFKLPTAENNHTLIVDGALANLLVFTSVTNDDGSVTTTLRLADGLIGVPSITKNGGIEMLETATCPVAKDYGAE